MLNTTCAVLGLKLFSPEKFDVNEIMKYGGPLA
jgi:hypothetical protein